MASAGQPVFIVGAPRSGTSLLYKLLCLHPDSAWVSNWLRRAPRLHSLAVLNRLAGRAEGLRTKVWFGADGDSAYAYGRKRSPAHRAFPQPVEGEPLFRTFDLPEASTQVDPSRRQLALRHAVADVTKRAGGRVFVSKRIAHNRRLSLLHGIFPGARFIALTRDGRAVAESLSRVDWWPTSHVWWYGDTPLAWEEQGGDPWELCARHWVNEIEAIENGLAQLPAANVLQLRYEDLIEQPVATLGTVSDFCRLPRLSRWRRAFERVRLPDNNERWRRNLGDAAGRVEALQADWLRKCGYLP